MSIDVIVCCFIPFVHYVEMGEFAYLRISYSFIYL